MSNNEKARENYERYNILITPSSELFKQTLVVMMSAILNCKFPCNFYIMQCTWTEQQKEECRMFVSSYPQNAVEFIEVDENVFKFFTPWKGRFGTYYKLLAHLYLSESVDRILYLDCDSFINKDGIKRTIDCILKENI